MGLEEFVQMLPDFRHPVDDLVEISVSRTQRHLCLDQLTSKIPSQETYRKKDGDKSNA